MVKLNVARDLNDPTVQITVKMPVSTFNILAGEAQSHVTGNVAGLVRDLINKKFKIKEPKIIKR